jgi:hypothetical protein
LGAEFKKIYATFPDLKAHVSSKVVSILESIGFKLVFLSGCLFDESSFDFLTSIASGI